MCRSIVTLRGQEGTTEDDVRAAARQYVRKISGYRVPSKANEAVFERAVDQVAEATRLLLDQLTLSRSGSRMANSRSLTSSTEPRASTRRSSPRPS